MLTGYRQCLVNIMFCALQNIDDIIQCVDRHSRLISRIISINDCQIFSTDVLRVI